MNRKTAQILVASLLGRIDRSGGKILLPNAALSSDEIVALEVLAGVVAPIRTVAMKLPTPPKVVLKLHSPKSLASAPSETERRICIDFGTAMSKAWLSGKKEKDTFPLVLGRSAGTGDQLPLPSSIYISNGGKIYFGASAETQHRQETDPTRMRFDNLKRMLSDAEVGQDLYGVPLDKGIDPTSSGLTKGDLLVLYLGWFTDMALIAALTVSGADDTDAARLIRRRFAVPCFDDAKAESWGSGRAAWANAELAIAIRRSQIVADTLHGNWVGLEVATAKAVLDAVKQLPIADLPDVLVKHASIREPVAAGASLFEEQLDGSMGSGKIRQYILVVDAGAGTTDFALFLARRSNDDEPIRYSLISPSVRLSRIAGNEFDGILQNVVLKSCGINPKNGAPRSEEDFGIIKRQLAARIRNIKQELFTSRDGKSVVRLTSNASGVVLLDDFLKQPRMKKAARELNGIVQDILEGVFSESYNEPFRISRQKQVVHVLLTGGSSQVGVIKSLASAVMHVNGVDFQLREIAGTPSWINRLDRELADLVTSSYPQCAVAIGGSSPEMPEELAELTGAIDTPGPGRRVLERFQSGGI